MIRGEIFWADLRPRSGSEQSGKRPVVVVSHDGFNTIAGWRSVVVVPLSTSAKQSQRGPTAVEVPRGTGGLERASVALCHQVTTLDRGKLTTRIGTMPRLYLERIGLGLRAALDLIG